jgi:hypothetical protein
MNSYAPDIQLSRTGIPRITQLSFGFWGSAKPYLLENRIAITRLAAELLCVLEGATEIDVRRRKGVDGLLRKGCLTIDETLPRRLPPEMR